MCNMHKNIVILHCHWEVEFQYPVSVCFFLYACFICHAFWHISERTMAKKRRFLNINVSYQPIESGERLREIIFIRSHNPIISEMGNILSFSHVSASISDTSLHNFKTQNLLFRHFGKKLWWQLLGSFFCWDFFHMQ